MVENCFVPNGTLYLRYDYHTGNINLSRCCLLKPFISIPFEDFLKIDDVIDYAKKFDYQKPEQWDLSSDRCKVCNFPRTKIEQVCVGFSYACNMKCYNCFYEGHHSDSEELKNLYFETLEKIKGHHLESIQLTDVGEPFFYFYKTLDYLNSLSKEKDATNINFLTNGSLLSKERIDELVSASKKTGIVYSFVVSVDGITKETYENTRIGGKFEKTIENICYLKQFFNISINYTIRKPNMNDVLKIKSFFKNLGFNRVDIYYDIYDEECKALYYKYEDLLKAQAV